MQEEWTPKSRLQVPAIVLPMIGKEISSNQRMHHPTAFNVHKLFDTAPIVIWDEDCNNQVEVVQGTKLSNDGRLHLPKSGCGVAVLKT